MEKVNKLHYEILSLNSASQNACHYHLTTDDARKF